MRYRCIIVDDDPISTGILSKYVESVPVLELLGTCTNCLQAFDLMLKRKIDLIYLDIGMPDFSGINLVNALPHPPSIIFTSGNKEFALDAFDLNAIDFLHKPISFERFLKAINKLCRYTENFEKQQLTTDFIYFRTNKKMVKVILENILYVESFKDYVLIHRIDGTEVKVKQPFNTIEAILPGNIFVRIHRSYIVSKSKITAFSKDFVEIGKLEIPIGRKYKDIASALVEN